MYVAYTIYTVAQYRKSPDRVVILNNKENPLFLYGILYNYKNNAYILDTVSWLYNDYKPQDNFINRAILEDNALTFSTSALKDLWLRYPLTKSAIFQQKIDSYKHEIELNIVEEIKKGNLAVIKNCQDIKCDPNKLFNIVKELYDSKKLNKKQIVDLFEHPDYYGKDLIRFLPYVWKDLDTGYLDSFLSEYHEAFNEADRAIIKKIIKDNFNKYVNITDQEDGRALETLSLLLRTLFFSGRSTAWASEFIVNNMQDLHSNYSRFFTGKYLSGNCSSLDIFIDAFWKDDIKASQNDTILSVLEVAKKNNQPFAIRWLSKMFLCGYRQEAKQFVNNIIRDNEQLDSFGKSALVIAINNNHKEFGQYVEQVVRNGEPRYVVFNTWEDYIESPSVKRYEELAGHEYVEIGKLFPLQPTVFSSDSVKEWRNFIQEYPFHPATDDAYYYLSMGLFYENKRKEALETIKTFRSTFMPSTDARNCINELESLIINNKKLPSAPKDCNIDEY